MDILKQAVGREVIEKEGGVMHSFSPEERMSFSQLISFNHRGDPDLADVLPINPNSMELFDAVGNGILLCKMVNNAVPGTIESKLINVKKPLNVFQIKENLSQAIKGANAIGCKTISITPPLIMEKREHIILGLIWQVLKATLGLKINLKNHPNMIRLKKDEEDLSTFQNLPTEEMLLRWLNYHLRNAGSDKVVKNFSGDLKDGVNYTLVLNQLDPKVCDLSGLNANDLDRATKVIDDTLKLEIPKFLRPEDIVEGNPKLNLIFCGEIFNSCPGLADIQPFSEAERMGLSVLISERHKDDESLKNKLPIDPNSKDLLKASRDGQLFTKMLNRAIPAAIDESQINFSDNLEEKQMAENLQKFLDAAKNQNLKVDHLRPAMIIDQKEDLVLGTLWEILKREADDSFDLNKNPNLFRLKSSGEESEQFKQLKGAEHFLLRWINYHLKNAGNYKTVENFTEHLKDGIAYTVLLNQLDSEKCDDSALNDSEEVRLAKVVDNANNLGVPKFVRPQDIQSANEKLNLLFCYEIYLRKNGLRNVEPFSDADRLALAILISEHHKTDEHLQKYLPINPQSKELFTTTAQSVLLSKMVQRADSNVIDMSQINTNEGLEQEQIEDNLKKSLVAAKHLNCDIKNIGVPAILNQVEDLVMKLLWEIILADLRKHLNPEQVPLLCELKNQDEDIEDFKKINEPQHYLLRWINFHLKNAGSDKEVKNFGEDLKDGTAYVLLLNQLDPIQCDKSGLDQNEQERANKVLDNAALLGVPKFLTSDDIVNGNENLNLLLCAELFWRNNGLEPKKAFANEEKRCFARIINEKLKDDAEVSDIIPINPNDNSLFDKLRDGRIICKLVNSSVPGTIDSRAINVKNPLTPFQIKENLTLGLSSAASVGCKVDEITPFDIAKGKENEDLKLLSEIFKAKPQWNLNVKDHPYLLRLKNNEEEIGELLKLSPEDMLLRWFNHHLKNAGNNEGIKNYDENLADCKNFTLLLNQLDKEKIDKSGLDDELNKRAEKVLENSKALGVVPFMDTEDLLAANPKLNFLFTYDIFNGRPGLTLNEEEKFEAAGLLKDDVGDSREERSFRMWVNSLNIPGIHVNNLFEDIKDGIVLLKVLDRVEPGCVDWKKVEMKPNHRIKKNHNANYAVDIGKNMKFSLVGIGGIDLVDGNKKLALALIWQMVRKHTLQLLGGWNEEKLLQWALEKVQKEPKISSFKDKSIANCHFLFNLLAAIEPRVINWELVTPGSTPEEIENNCNYVLSIARKLGATIFLVWEDIKDCNPKMIMTLFAALVKIEKYGKQEEMIDFTKKTNTDL